MAGAHTHGCWLGSYEAEKQRLFAQLVRSGELVFDVGANAGFYTLLASRLVGPRGRVVAFEPLPRNLAFLRAHLALNRIANTTVVDAAVSQGAGTARFAVAAGSAQGMVSAAGELEVRTVGIDEAVYSGTIPAPTFIKMDIEGGELAALQGATRVLAEQRPVIMLATHGAEVHEPCIRLLESQRYTVKALDGSSVSSSDELLATPKA